MPPWSPGSISPPRDRTRPTPTASTGAWSSALGASRPGSAIAGTGPDGLWTKDDTDLAERVRTELRRRPGAGQPELRSLIEKLRTQRLEPLAKALGATADGLPTARRLIVLPSRAMAGIPIEALLAPDDTRIVSYAPSATVFKYLRDAAPARPPCRPAGPGRPGLRAARQIERAPAAARPRPAGQRGGARLQRRDPRPEAGRCLARPTTARH